MIFKSGALAFLVAIAAVTNARAGCPNQQAQNLREAFDGLGNTCTTDAFAPAGTFVTPLSVSSTSSQTALPAGPVIMVSNVGSVVACINLGLSSAVTATTADIPVQPANFLILAVGSNTNLAAVTATGCATLNIAGGSGG